MSGNHMIWEILNTHCEGQPTNMHVLCSCNLPQGHIYVYGPLCQSIHQKPRRAIWLFVKSSQMISSWDAEVKDMIRHVIRHVPLHQRGKKNILSFCPFSIFLVLQSNTLLITLQSHQVKVIKFGRAESAEMIRVSKCLLNLFQRESCQHKCTISSDYTRHRRGHMEQQTLVSTCRCSIVQWYVGKKNKYR